MKIFAIAINTFREAVRNKILYSVLLFVAALLGASAFFGSVTIGDRMQVIKDCGLFSLSFFGAVITIVTGVSLLHKELKQKTIYNILSKPVERWQFILGKHLGLTMTVCLLLSLMGVGLFAFVAILERRPDWLLFQGILFAMMEVTVLASVVMFFSSMAVTTTLPGLFTLGAYIAGHSLAYLRLFITEDVNAGGLLRSVVEGFSWIIPDLSLFNVNAVVVYGASMTPAQAGYAGLYALAYSAAALSVAAIIFQRRELT